MRYIIRIAGISILADVPYLLHPNDSTNGFVFPVSEDIKADLSLVIRPVDLLPEMRDVRFTDTKRSYVGEGETAGTFHHSARENPPYACVSRQSVHDGFLYCDYLPGNEYYMNYARNILTLMDIEATLLDYSVLILHSSLICYDRQGIVFSAPSGTGKSTQAELWKQYENAEILNGDRAALRKINNEWQAFGLPYAGTSGIYKNESAPLKAVVALRQAQDNRIRQIRGAEAFKYLYPETMIHRWDPDFERRATDLLLKIIGEVPVFLLECRPDQEAVSLLRDTLKET